MIRALLNVIAGDPGGISWAAVAVMSTIGISLIAATWRLARVTARLETKLDDLDRDSRDHEDRLRALERAPRGPGGRGQGGGPWPQMRPGSSGGGRRRY